MANDVFGKNVRMRRAEPGLDIGTVAELAGVNRNSITNYERGQEPQAGKLEDLCRALRISAESLFDPELYRAPMASPEDVNIERIVEGIARRVFQEELRRKTDGGGSAGCTCHSPPDFMRRKK